MTKKVIPSISSNFDIMNELNENSYMRKNNIAEHIEFYFAVNLENLNELDKLDKILELYKYIEYDKRNDVIHKSVIYNFVKEINNDDLFIHTVCLTTFREPGDDVELEYKIPADASCISLTFIIHDNESDVFNKFFRKPVYYQNKKNKYKIWAITEIEVMKDYLNMIYDLNFLRLKLCISLRKELKNKKNKSPFNLHKYNPLPLVRMIRFIPLQHSHTDIKLLIVKKDKFYNDLVKNKLLNYIYLGITSIN